MADRSALDKRSALMARVRTRNTFPEIAVRRAIHSAGLRYRLHRKDLPGNPDIVLPKLRTAVFVHGCFWHSHTCAKGRKRPQSNVEFWAEKLERNRQRDLGVQAALLEKGWSVEVIWECELDECLPALVDELRRRREALRV